MKHSIIRSALLAAALLVSASLSLAAEIKPGAAGEAIGNAKASGAKAKNPAATAKVKLVDINSATKRELKTLPGIGDAEADRIIAGRPYLSKAHLVTRNIIPAGPYQLLSKRIIAKQTLDAQTKPAK